MNPDQLIARKYRLLRRLAEGGMGEIWAARNERTQRDVAIKFLLPSLTQHPEAVTRFVQEASATGSLRHPAIVDLFDAGRFEGRPYLVMELLHGESLEQRLERDGPLSAAEVCSIFAPIARGLALAHDAGIVHRDLSSANVFLARTSGGGMQPKVLDFGVSKVLGPDLQGPVRTERGAVLGSPWTMSPEQAEGADGVDHRTDVWALGVLMYLSLTGRQPFEAPTYPALLLAIVSQPHEPLQHLAPRLLPELVSVVEHCLVKDRRRRMPRASLLAERLERIARSLRPEAVLELAPTAAPPPSVPRLPVPPAPPPPTLRAHELPSARRRLGAAGATGLGGVAVGLIVGLLAGAGPSDDDAATAQAEAVDEPTMAAAQTEADAPAAAQAAAVASAAPGGRRPAVAANGGSSTAPRQKQALMLRKNPY